MQPFVESFWQPFNPR